MFETLSASGAKRPLYVNVPIPHASYSMLPLHSDPMNVIQQQ